MPLFLRLTPYTTCVNPAHEIRLSMNTAVFEDGIYAECCLLRLNMYNVQNIEWVFKSIVVAFVVGKTTLDARCSVVNLSIFNGHSIPAEIAFRLRWVNTGSFAMKMK